MKDVLFYFFIFSYFILFIIIFFEETVSLKTASKSKCEANSVRQKRFCVFYFLSVERVSKDSLSEIHLH